jgi:hypothetical protein
MCMATLCQKCESRWSHCYAGETSLFIQLLIAQRAHHMRCSNVHVLVMTCLQQSFALCMLALFAMRARQCIA